MVQIYVDYSFFDPTLMLSNVIIVLYLVQKYRLVIIVCNVLASLLYCAFTNFLTMLLMYFFCTFWGPCTEMYGTEQFYRGYRF